MDVYAEIARLRARGVECALCTIIQTQGSTPGKSAMKMLVRSDGTFAGTVGGGCLEAEVLEAALASLADEKPRLLEFSLNERDYPDSGLLCGGKVRVYVEPITEPRVHLFGGGHVSGAITAVARLAGFHVTVGDDREAFASRERHPGADEVVCADFAEQARALGTAEGRFLLIVTRGHAQDGAVLQALFEQRAAPRYLGLIGSEAKKAVLFDKLASAGVGADFLARVRTPMGLPIGARTHEEIAVSVVAEMIRVRRLGSGTPAAS